MKVAKLIQKLQEIEEDYPDSDVVVATPAPGTSFHPKSGVPNNIVFHDSSLLFGSYLGGDGNAATLYPHRWVQARKEQKKYEFTDVIKI